MKFVSWNVNGLRACLKKGFDEFFEYIDADIFCVQETKLQPEQSDFFPNGYHSYYNSAIRKGYSGTAVFTKEKPVAVDFGIDGKHDDEGRVITLEYPDFYFVGCYTPNSKMGLERIDYRVEFEDDIREYLCRLDKKKPVIYCGDMNVAHNEIDLKHPKTNQGNAGFSDQERGKISELIDAGFVDSFRYLHPDETGAYSWWSYKFNARKTNAGWRIDYFFISDRLKDSIIKAEILSDIFGSDHCPVYLELDNI